MRTMNIVVEDTEYALIEQAKSTMTWREFIIASAQAILNQKTQ